MYISECFPLTENTCRKLNKKDFKGIIGTKETVSLRKLNKVLLIPYTEESWRYELRNI